QAPATEEVTRAVPAALLVAHRVGIVVAPKRGAEAREAHPFRLPRIEVGLLDLADEAGVHACSPPAGHVAALGIAASRVAPGEPGATTRGKRTTKKRLCASHRASCSLRRGSVGGVSLTIRPRAGVSCRLHLPARRPW